MKIHQDIDSWIAGALSGALTAEEQQTFEQHLAACADCRSLYEAQKKMDQRFKQTFPKWKPDANFEDRVAANFRRELSHSANRERRSFFAAPIFKMLSRLAASRPAQAFAALLILAAMIKSGSLITGESLTTNFANHRAPTFSAPAPQAAESNGVANHESAFANSTMYAPSSRMIAAKDKAMNPSAGGGVHTFGEKSKSMFSFSPMTAMPTGSMVDKLATSQYALAQPQNQLQKKMAASSLGDGSMGFGAGYGGGRASVSGALKAPQTAAASPADNRKLIRNARLDFEVANYEVAADTIRKITHEDQGSIDTNDSSRGANGKLRGTIVVKIPPANLDRFLLQLRALGDLKNQQITTEDVTKSYFDTDARVRNSKVMEQRLLDMLKTKTGKVTDLLKVEEELNRVRGNIEEMQGQLKLWDSLVAYATVTISLSEKDLNTPAAYLLRKQAQLSLFAANVEKTFAEAKADAKKANAQIVDSHLDRDENGRVSATLALLIAPDNAEMVISEMKTLGRIQRFSEQSQRIARGGNDVSGNSESAKTERDKVTLNLTILPDEERVSQRTDLTILTTQIADKVAHIKQQAASAGVSVKSSTFNQRTNGEETAALTFRLPLAKNSAFLENLKALGSVEQFSAQRSDDLVSSANGEAAPAEISLTLHSRGAIVANDNGIFATIRRTLAQGFGALMWSVRMIGVSLAFIAPWAIGIALVLWVFLRRKAKK